jgi:hypothetical protein
MSLNEILTKVRRASRDYNPFYFITLHSTRMWEKILTIAFNYPSRCYAKLREGEVRKVTNHCSVLKYFSDHFGIYSLSRSMIGKVTSEKDDTEIAGKLLEAIYHKIEDPFLVDAATAEVLAKVIAYRNLEVEDLINIPVINKDGIAVLTTYRVDTVLNLWKKVVAFGLIPKKGPPLLLYRGTNFSVISQEGRSSILSDLDPHGPGHALFLYSQNCIHAWLEKAAKKGDKARVFGHSLGGSLASYTTIYEHELINTDPFSVSYAFNPPGVVPSVVAIWDDIPKEQRPEIVTYLTRGDLISKFGELFGDVYELASPRPLSPLVAHQTLLFSQPLCYIHAVDTQQENGSRSRKFYTNLHKQTTSLAFRFGLKHLLPNPYE